MLEQHERLLVGQRKNEVFIETEARALEVKLSSLTHIKTHSKFSTKLVRCPREENSVIKVEPAETLHCNISK